MVNLNNLERDWLRQAELCPRHTMMKKKKEADRRSGKTISKNGQEWTLPAQLGRLKTGQYGKGLLPTHLCFQGYGIESKNRNSRVCLS